jgi:hypothetical protein
MTISGNIPGHLLAAARTGFLSAPAPTVQPWAPIATMMNMDAKSIDLVDIGDAPMPVEAKGRTERRAFIEKMLTVTPKNWEVTVGVSYNATKDDQTGTVERKCRSAGESFPMDMSNKAFKALNDGDATTNYGAGYDGLSFFNNSHIDKGAEYQTAQDNLNALAISLDNFETVMVTAKGFRNDQGEFVNYNYDLLITSPTNWRTASQICGNPQAYDTANRESNPYAGLVRPLVSPQFDTTAWVLTASGLSIKPILIVVREQPNLQAAWFDPDAGDGGMYYFKFYARYNHFYTNWRTAIMGNT